MKTHEWIGPSAPGDGFLFVKDGEPPHPVWSPKGGRFGGELRTVYSYKMKRDFNLCWPLEWDHFLLLDCDPLVKWICERPAKVEAIIDGKKSSATFDMWILWHDGREELREVKPAENEEKSSRQITLQKQWAALIGLDHQVVTENKVAREPLLTNCRRLHPYLSQFPGANWERKVLAHVDQSSPVPLRALVGATDLETPKLLHAALNLVWQRDLIAPLATQPWEELTLTRPANDTQRTPYC